MRLLPKEKVNLGLVISYLLFYILKVVQTYFDFMECKIMGNVINFTSLWNSISYRAWFIVLECILFIAGRLDTLTAPEFEKEIEGLEENISELIIDMKNLEYTSSAGLRALLKAQKLMSGRGTMKIINVNETIKEVFDITGFSEILSIN